MFLLVLITGISLGTFAQTWQETWNNMSKEEKMMKMRSFRDANQKFLKDSLGMTSDQLKSIDTTNSNFMKEMRQIEKSNESDDQKLAKAKTLASNRSIELDNIMGKEKHDRFKQYMYEKLQKAQE